jgi:hypothetical protein
MMPILPAMDFMASTVSLTALPPCSASDGGLGGHVVGDLGVLGVLHDAGRHLLDAGGGLFDRGGLLAGGLRQRLGGGGDLVCRTVQRIRGKPDFVDRPDQPFHRLGDRILEFADFVLAVYRHLHAQIAFGEVAGARESSCMSRSMRVSSRTKPAQSAIRISV